MSRWMAICLLLASSECCFAQDEPTANARPGAGSSVAPDRIALLVGIGDYPEGSNVDDLPGAENDPDLIRDLLIDRFGFAPENVKILRNEQATHERIVRTFHEWLIQRSGPATEAIFWYSGHGSRVPDRSGVGLAEADDMDSTLVAWDSRLGDRNGAYDIPDDELGSLIRALSRKTRRVTIVTDCCYSGGVTRGAFTAAVRAAPVGTEPFDPKRIEPFWPKDLPYLDDDRLGAEPDPPVHIAACGPGQIAREFNPGYEGVSYGALTYFLHYRMRNLRHDTTYRDLIGSVSTWITANFPSQSVHYSGPVDRVVFENRYQQRPAGFPAHVRFDDRRILLPEVGLDAGWLLGLRPASVVQLRDFVGRDLGTATVRRVTATAAVALLDGDLPPEFGARGILASELSRPEGHQPLVVVIPHPALSKRIREEYGDRIEVSAGPRPGATYRIDVDPPGAGEGDPALARFLAPSGFPIWPGPSESARNQDWIERITERLDGLLDSEYGYLGLLELSSLHSGLQIAGQFQNPSASELVRGEDASGPWLGEAISADVQPLGAGERGQKLGQSHSNDFHATYIPRSDRFQLLRINVSNNEDEPLFFSILSVTDAREISVIAPREGESLRIPPHESRPVYARLTRHRSIEPGVPMRDRYLVIATRERANFHPLVQRSANRGSSDLGAMPPVIQNALSPTVTRGGSPRVELREGPAYGISTLDLLVDPPDQK